MTLCQPLRPLAAAAALAALTASVPSAQQGNTLTVPFSDPSRPGSIRLSVSEGGIVVRGSNRADVLVTTRSSAIARDQREPPAGLRRLTQAPGLTVAEENNEMTISALRGEADVELQVPARVNLKLSTHDGGDIVVENTDGDIEATNHDGNIRLLNVAGSVVANTHDGDVRVVMTRAAGKAMAFASFDGDVDVTLPASTKASLKLRSDDGEIFTDFDVQVGAQPPATQTRPDGRLRYEVGQAVYGTINGGGPEIELRTFDGDIFVRRSPDK
jgi:DUF4097 and DUF4098 domain-containing protein YvlB